MPPKKKQQEGTLLHQLIVFIVGIIVVIASVYGIVFFLTKSAVEDVEKTQGSIEQDLTKLGSIIADIKESLGKEEDEEVRQEVNDSLLVGLYYYNLRKDEEIDPSLPCSPESILPVTRQIAVTATPIQDTLNLLISGNLDDEEKIAGFTTEFPHPEFLLIGTRLKNGVLTLEFTDPKDFTTGGACRVSLLKLQIEKTALQFKNISEVVLEPEGIFSP